MIAALLLAAAAAASPALENAFDQATLAYDASEFETAALRYEEIIAAGVADPVVFYNLANTRFRLGDLGGAIANYERTLRIDPRFEGATDNLKYAVAATRHRLARPLRADWREAMLFWDERLRYNEVRWLGVALWAAFWAVLLVRLNRRERKWTLLAIVLFLASTAFLTSSFAKLFPVPLAVAVEDTVPVRTGTADDDTVRFELAPGDRVRIEDERDGSLLVSTVNGERGWADADALIRVGPPYRARFQTAGADS